jgi:hypothetical protein
MLISSFLMNSGQPDIKNDEINGMWTSPGGLSTDLREHSNRA